MTEPLRGVTIKCRIAIVGAQAERVARVVELLSTKPDDDEDEHHQAEPFPSPFVVEYLPCVAKFGQYLNQNGERVRYLVSLEYHGPDGKQPGSSLAPFWDMVDNDDEQAAAANQKGISTDKSTRLDSQQKTKSSLKLPGIAGVAIGCGIERDSDIQDITRFFDTLASTTTKASDQNDQPLQVLIDHVKPNGEYTSMKEEMEAYKMLDANGKAEATRLGTLGPGKMLKFVRSLALSVIQNVMEDEKEEVPLLQVVQVEESSETTNTVLANTGHAHAAEGPQFGDEPPFEIDPTETRYACRMCRSLLFGEYDLEYPRHAPHVHTFSSRKAGQAAASSTCQSIFLATGLVWMGDMSESQGKIHCPTCSAKVGTWNWSGAQCSCGTWITPAIQIPVSKVDTIFPVSTMPPPTTIPAERAILPVALSQTGESEVTEEALPELHY